MSKPKKSPPELKKEAKAVFDVMVDFQVHHYGMPPTIREIMTMTGMRSTSTVSSTLEYLHTYGHVYRHSVGNSHKYVAIPDSWRQT